MRVALKDESLPFRCLIRELTQTPWRWFGERAVAPRRGINFLK